MRIQTIAMIGATGFIGRHLAAELTRRGYRLRALTRRRERSKHMLVFPRLELVQANVHAPGVLETELAGCQAVVNLAGVLNERRPGDFDRVHAELPARIVAACHANGIGRYLHMSALGAAGDAPSRYLRSKAAGEQAVMGAARQGLGVTVFRPSVVFGPDDDFFNRFATLLALTPLALPLACASARFAPVYVEDVVQAFARTLTDNDSHGEAYSLCGPEQYTLADLVRYAGQVSGHERRVFGLGDRLSYLQGLVMERLPGQIFTTDNYRSMQVPNICDGDDLARLGIRATGIEAIVPGYLGQRCKQARYDEFRSHAGRDEH